MTSQQSDESSDAESNFSPGRQVVVKLCHCHNDGIIAALQQRFARPQEQPVIRVHRHSLRRRRLCLASRRILRVRFVKVLGIVVKIPLGTLVNEYTIRMTNKYRLLLFGQRPRRGPEGTLVLCNRGDFVCPYVPPPCWALGV